jgi:hypothetical protein
MSVLESVVLFAIMTTVLGFDSTVVAPRLGRVSTTEKLEKVHLDEVGKYVNTEDSE